MECYPHPGQDEQLLVSLRGKGQLGNGLLLLLLQGGLMELQEGLGLLVLLLLQAELKMVRLLLVDWEGSDVGPGGSESSQGWHCFEQGRLRCMPSTRPR